MIRPRLGPFDLIGPAGAGAMGEVWRAVHRAQQVSVAIKVVTVDRARAARYRRLFGREVRAVAGLDHGGIVRVFDHGVVPAALSERTLRRLPIGAPWLAMTWLGGGTLRARRGLLRWPALRQTLLTLLDALGHAHARGLVHRDFKDANVMLGESGPVITDFGLALREDDVATAATGRIVGTPYFMAPEVVRGEIRGLGPWTDLYGLGCLAFALATGEPPFAGGVPLKVMHAQSGAPRPPVVARHPVPDGFEGWVHRLMAIDPRVRFRFAADAAFALMQLDPAASGGSADAPIEPRPDGDAGRTLWAPPAFVAVDEVAWSDAAPAASQPPMAAHWRRPPGPVRPPSLSGVGRSLVALREPRLRGRMAERDVLWAALRRVVDGRGCQVVVLSGPSGAGKTRLARWLQYRAHELGVAESCGATHAPSPEPGTGPVPMLAQALRCRGLQGEARAAHIRRMLRLPRGEAVAGRIASALGEGAAVGAGPSVGGESARLSAWLDASDLLTRQRPAVALIDDAQWADDALELVLAALARDAGRTLYVLTVREDVAPGPGAARLARIAAHPRTVGVALGPMPADALRRLVDDRLPLDPPTAEMVQRRAAGSPLFAAELVRHWVQSGALVEGPAGFRVRASDRDALPDGFTDLWSARLDRAVADAEPWAAEALEGAAVLGIGPDPDEWIAICAAAGLTPPDQAIEQLLHARLVAESGSRGWRFAHAMLREALIGRARAAGRLRRWHHLAAGVLAEAAGGDRDRRHALHLQRAGLPGRALPIFIAVAWRAWRISEDRRARRAIIEGARSAWRAGVPDAHAARADLRALWAVCARGGRVGLRHARRALTAVDRVDPLTAARIRFAWAYADTGGSDPARTEARFAVAVEAAEVAAADPAGGGDAAILAVRGQRWRATLLLRVGRPDGAEACLDAAEVLAARRPGVLDSGEVAYLAARRAEIALLRGDRALAWTLANQARAGFSAIGHRGGLGLIARQLSEIARARGEQLDAERWLRTARDTWRELGRVQAVRLSELNLGLVLSEMGRFDEARGLLQAVRGAGCPAHYDVLACLLLLACDADAGDWAAWRAHWAGIEPLRAGRVIEVDVAIAARLAARTAAAAGAEREAAEAWRLAVDQFTRLGRQADVAAMHAERSKAPTEPMPSVDR